MSITPRNRAGLPKDASGSMEEPSRSNISGRWVVPVNPNVSTRPYRSTAELIALRSRNFTPASLERESRRKAASAARGSAVSSRAMYMEISSVVAARSIMPPAENTIRP